MKKWKHLLMVGVILGLAMVLFPFFIASAQEVTVSIDAPDEVDGGTDFITTVDITDVTDFDACNYDITYNPLILEVTDVTYGIIGETVIPVDMWGFVPAETQGTIRVIQNVPGLSGVSGSGYLAQIHFHVVGSAGKTSNITPSNGVLSDITASEIPTTWVGDSVRVPGSGSGGGGGGGGGGKAAPPKLKLDIMGKLFSLPMTKEGVLEEDFEATSPDGAITLRFAEGTQALDSEGDRLENITVDAVSGPPEAPDKSHAIGVAYEFAPDSATFDHEVELIMQYDPEGLPEGVSEADLLIACYESESEQPMFLPSEVNTVDHTVSVWISHFTLFAIIGREEACFDFANLSISPTTVDPGESVTISAEVTNTGGLEGSCTVKLLIDDVEEATQEVTVAPGATVTVTFPMTRESSGRYSVEISGLVGEFTVTATALPFPWALLAGILGAPAAAWMVVAVVIWSRRKAA